MRRILEVISEVLFILIEKISIIVFSFIFFWGLLVLLSHPLSNHRDIATIVDLFLMIMPFVILRVVLGKDKIDRK